MSNLLSTYQTNVRKKTLPTIESSKDTLSSKKIYFTGNKTNSYMISIGKSSVVITEEMRKMAKILAEHIDIIEESRKEIQNGNTLTWDELKKGLSKTTKRS